MPKLQERTTQTTKQAYVSLPKEHIDLLGWKKGAVLIVTTDKCYENREWPWGYRENEPMGGFDPYSNSTSGTVRVVALQDVDVAVRHAESFAAMKDALTA